ncbi:MAG: rubrerythrin family protein, partial [Anaerolineae bacterium]|nr:rubrerythrin family protein [Anaerolineae bacterium]
MREMTKANLEAAFAGESQAHMKYLIFADQAEAEGFPEVARLFRAIAYAERVHATNHLRELGGIRDTVANLEVAVGGENYENTEMYPAFNAVAKLQGEKGAMLSIHYALEAEKIHEAMYTEAKQLVEAGRDLKAAPVYICPKCGYTVIGDPPDKCPVCGVAKA